MATPSYKGYQTSVLAGMGNEEAIKNSWSEVPGYEMFANTGATTTSTSTDTDSISKNREVEIGLGKSVYSPMSDGEKQQYLDSLTDEQYRQMRTYKNQGYSFEASRTLLENSEGLANPTAVGTEKYNPKGNFFKNMVAGAYDSVTGLPRMIGNWGGDLVGRVAKKLGADEEKVNYLVQDWKNYISSEQLAKEMGANKESATYKITKGVGDLTQVAAGEGLAKGALKGTQALNKINQVKNSGLLGKMAVGAVEGAADMGLYSMVSESELPSGKDLALGAGLGAAFPLAGAGLKAAGKGVKSLAGKAASKLELSGMLNPSKLNNVKNMLIEEGVDLASAGLKGGTAEEVGTWMIERGMKGDKQTIITKLGEHSQNARNLKLTTLAKSTTTHNVPAADGMLETVLNVIDDVPGLEEKIGRVKELMSKKGNYTLSELDEIKTLSDSVLNLFKQSGEVKAGAAKEGLANLRGQLKTYIEKAAEKEGLGNIKMLNNEIQVAKALEKAISAKDSADMAREMLSIFNKGTIGGALGGGIVGGPFDENTTSGKIGNIIVGALAGKYLFSTQAKTKLAAGLNKLSGGSQKELTRLIEGSTKTLSKKTEQELLNILQDVEATPMEVLGNGGLTAIEAQSIIDYVQPSLFE